MANLRSINNKIDQFTSLYSSLKIDIVLINETWLTNNSNLTELHNPDFHLISEPRINKRGGGIAVLCRHIYFHSSICNDVISLKFSVPFEFLPFFLLINNTITLCIVLFIPPKSSDNKDIDLIIGRIIEQISSKYSFSELIICGDINKCDMSLTLGEYNLRDIICQPTRGNAFLDKFYTTQFLSDIYDKIHVYDPIGRGDHNPVAISCTSLPSFTPVKQKQILYDFRKSNIDIATDYLNSLKWNHIFENQEVNNMMELLYQSIYFCLSLIPSKIVYRTSKDKPWINNIIKSLINSRYKAYRKRNFPLYLHYKHKVNQEILKAKQFWANNIKNHSNVWKVVKDLDNKCHTAQKYSVSDLPPILQKLKSIYGADANFKAEYINNNDLIDENKLKSCIISSFKNFQVKKAQGPDKVPNKFIKLIQPNLIEAIYFIAMRMIKDGIYPSSLKEGYIHPIPKKKQQIPITSDLSQLLTH